MRVAVMVACYNRKEMTRRCLLSLEKQFLDMPGKQFDIYVYDDCSTDGTYEMLKDEFLQVYVIRGNGNAYWCKSMYYLMRITVEKRYDFYMMVNDDVCFFSDGIKKMFCTYNKIGESCGVVGAFKSTFSFEATYGGRDNQMKLLPPNGHAQQCIFANWNCFLIDANVIDKTGIIDGKYCHAWGDWDYTFRMVKNGFCIYETPDYIGECDANLNKGTYKDKTLGKRIRLKKLFSPKGLPFNSYLRYNVKTKGFHNILIFILGYCSVIIYILMGKELY